jgi:hypothetical protein
MNAMLMRAPFGMKALVKVDAEEEIVDTEI